MARNANEAGPDSNHPKKQTERGVDLLRASFQEQDKELSTYLDRWFFLS